MNLIYIDDYGNTGTNLDDTQQPIFGLFAVSIPENMWIEVERQLYGIIEEIGARLNNKKEFFELHAREFFAVKNKAMQNISIADRYAYAEKILEIVINNSGKLYGFFLEKQTLKQFDFLPFFKGFFDEFQDLTQEEEVQLQGFIKKAIDPYTLTFFSMLGNINDKLLKDQQQGMIIVDEHDTYGKLRYFRTYTLLRSHFSSAFAIIEMPMEGKSQHNILLQVSDMLGYLIFSHVRRTLTGGQLLPNLQNIWDKSQSILTLVDGFRTPVLNSSTSMMLQFILTAELLQNQTGLKINKELIEKAEKFLTQFNQFLLGRRDLLQVAPDNLTGTRDELPDDQTIHPNNSEMNESSINSKNE